MNTAENDDPRIVSASVTDEIISAALADGTPGFAAAYQIIGRMARMAWDELGEA